MMERVQGSCLSHHKNKYYHICLFLASDGSNNVVKYQSLIVELQMAIKTKITSLEICGDSKLIINQLLTLYEVKSDDIVPYFQYATQLMKKFKQISLVHIP